MATAGWILHVLNLVVFRIYLSLYINYTHHLPSCYARHRHLQSKVTFLASFPSTSATLLAESVVHIMVYTHSMAFVSRAQTGPIDDHVSTSMCDLGPTSLLQKSKTARAILMAIQDSTIVTSAPQGQHDLKEHHFLCRFCK